MEGIYQEAFRIRENAKSAGDCRKAEELFESIAEYKDAQEQVQRCAEYIEHARKNDILESAILKMESSFDYEIEGALNMLRWIPGWKNADELARQCEERLAECAQQRMNQERARMSERWRFQGLCRHCGGELKGLITKKCVNCGQPKDY